MSATPGLRERLIAAAEKYPEFDLDSLIFGAGMALECAAEYALANSVSKVGYGIRALAASLRDDKGTGE